MNETVVSKTVRLSAHHWLNDLRKPPYVWHGALEDQEVLVVAVVNEWLNQGGRLTGEWAAYYQLPHQSASVKEVQDSGQKLPERVARDLFPGIEQRYRP